MRSGSRVAIVLVVAALTAVATAAPAATPAARGGGARPPAAPRPEVVRGRVEAFDAQAGTLRLRVDGTGSTARLEVAWNDGTRFSRGAAPAAPIAAGATAVDEPATATPDDLRPGMELTVHGTRARRRLMATAVLLPPLPRPVPTQVEPSAAAAAVLGRPTSRLAAVPAGYLGAGLALVALAVTGMVVRRRRRPTWSVPRAAISERAESRASAPIRPTVVRPFIVDRVASLPEVDDFEFAVVRAPAAGAAAAFERTDFASETLRLSPSLLRDKREAKASPWAAPAAPAPAATEEPTVLLVDDEPDIRLVVETVLRSHGFKVVTAGNGIEALEVLETLSPDVIVTDVNMPELDGWGLVRRLRALSRFSLTPVIFLSMLGQPSNRMRGYRLGADDYVVKPDGILELPTRVTAALERRDRLEVALRGREAEEGESRPGLAGQLDQLGLPTLLGSLEQERRTGELVVRPADGDVTGVRIRLRDGAVVTASLDGVPEVRNAEVVYLALEWSEGSFEFVPGAVDEEDEVGASITHLLMEGARLQDERERERGRDYPAA